MKLRLVAVALAAVGIGLGVAFTAGGATHVAKPIIINFAVPIANATQAPA